MARKAITIHPDPRGRNEDEKWKPVSGYCPGCGANATFQQSPSRQVEPGVSKQICSSCRGVFFVGHGPSGALDATRADLLHDLA